MISWAVPTSEPLAKRTIGPRYERDLAQRQARGAEHPRAAALQAALT
jgi:hypothetical protein